MKNHKSAKPVIPKKSECKLKSIEHKGRPSLHSNSVKTCKLLQNNSKIKIILATNDDGNSEIVVQYTSREGKLAHMCLQAKFLKKGNDLFSELLNAGWQSGGEKEANTEIERARNSALNAKVKITITDRSGWVDDCFIIGGKVIGTPKIRSIVHRSKYDSEQDAEHRLKINGSLDAWRNGLQPFCQESPMLVFAIAFALSAPTLRMLEDGLGLVFHLYGESGTGKSTIMDAGLSCYQAPSSSFATTRSLDTGGSLTLAALEERAAAHNDSFMAVDDISAANSKDRAPLVTALAYSVREGRGKARSKLGQKNMGYNTQSWVVAAMTNHEEPLDNSNSGQSRKKGEVARYIQIYVPKPENGGIFEGISGHETIREKCVAISNILKENFGRAGRHYIEYLAANKLTALGSLRKYNDLYRERLNKNYPNHGQQPRFVASFTKVYAAGRLAIDLGIAPFDKQLLDKSIQKAFERALYALRNNTLTNIEFLEELVAISGDRQRIPNLDSKGKAHLFGISAIGFHQSINGVNTMAIHQKYLRIIAEKYGISDCTHVLQKFKILVPDKLGDTTQQIQVTGFPGMIAKRPRWIVVDLHKLSAAATDGVRKEAQY